MTDSLRLQPQDAIRVLSGKSDPDCQDAADTIKGLLLMKETRDEAFDNAHQAASETHRSWKHRCYAITGALGLDFGDPDFEMPDEITKREEAEKLAAENQRRLAEAYKEIAAASSTIHDYKMSLKEIEAMQKAEREVLALQIRNQQRRIDDLLEANDRYLKRARAAEEVLLSAAASLAAAISLLERGEKKAAPSDKMFEQMLVDYRASLGKARELLKKPGGAS